MDKAQRKTQQSHNKRKEYQVQIQNKRSLYYCRFNSNTVSFNIKVITESTVYLSKMSIKKSNKKKKIHTKLSMFTNIQNH